MTGDVVAAVARGAAVVVEATPGAGKTTRVPSALLDAVAGDVVVLEPRRLAARLAAARVAHERGEPLGKTVGYQVRFDRRASAETRLSFVTEGVLTRRLMRDPSLAGVGAVVLDELHERHIHTDVALALLVALRRRRPLSLVAMSATLEVAPVLELLDAEHVRCPVVRHPVAIEYLVSKEPLEVQVAMAARKLVREGVRGHILVFLPGAADIRRAAERCRALELALFPLHGALPPAEQDAAVAPNRAPKLILATNVAESSITIDGVEAVIDSGLVKQASCSPWSGLSRLDVVPISRASAAQRAGRAGRTGPGRCVRLYSEREHQRMRAFDEPEIARSDLSEAVLALRLAGISDASSLAWLTPPPREALARAQALLDDLGAAALGRRIARFPVHPRLGRALVEAEERGAVDEVAGWAARLSEPAGKVERAAAQLAALCRRGPGSADAASCLLAGYPDRVARHLGGGELALADGGRAVLDAPLGEGAMLLVLEAAERTGKPALVRSWVPIRSDWLLDLFADRLVEESELAWSESRARVERVSRIRYRGLILDESRRAAEPSDQASALLFEAARRAALHRDEAIERRIAHAARQSESLRRFDERHLENELAKRCQGATSFADLGASRIALGPEDQRALARLAPERLRLAGGRELAVVYPPSGEPYVAGYLQDFFGSNEGPCLGDAPLVMHLWGPNRRALQVTRDLPSFWDEHYPALKKRLARRYPKHFWPDDPRRAPAKLFKDR